MVAPANCSFDVHLTCIIVLQGGHTFLRYIRRTKSIVLYCEIKVETKSQI